jgi:hypothetical protein
MSSQRAAAPRRFERTLQPELETLVTVETNAPHAVCHLVHRHNEDRRLQLDADEHGIVRFHARPSKGAEAIEFALDCTEGNGAHTRHTVALQPGTLSGPPPSAPKPRGTLRGRLSSDMMALPNRELVALGYPPRPDPARHPARYKRWLKRVMQPFMAVNPTKVAHHGVRFARSTPDLITPPKLASPTLPLPPPRAEPTFDQNSNNWSGAQLTQPRGQFFLIESDWNVPGVFNVNPTYPLGGVTYSAVAEWIGLDNNAAGTDLYQAGTDSECWVWFGWTITNYWMWIESLPFPPWAIPNFPVSPYDAVSVDIFVADQYGTTFFQNGSDGGLTPADDRVWFMIYNLSQNNSYWGTLSTGAFSENGQTRAGYSGNAAEFVIERPTDLSTGNPYPLGAFGSTNMNSCFYADALYGDQGVPLGADGSMPFDGNLTYLDMVDQATNNLLAVPFSQPDPFSPYGYQIFWLWVNSV